MRQKLEVSRYGLISWQKIFIGTQLVMKVLTAALKMRQNNTLMGFVLTGK